MKPLFKLRIYNKDNRREILFKRLMNGYIRKHHLEEFVYYNGTFQVQLDLNNYKFSFSCYETTNIIQVDVQKVSQQSMTFQRDFNRRELGKHSLEDLKDWYDVESTNFIIESKREEMLCKLKELARNG
ncbi:MAG: hypothetical protein MJZ34_07240 [Paludibacteraceae bacterium]|nr:hypothetical protein [Paludibacteraceae bacterium]